jgi:4-oxalocrotonate tautomerase
VPFVEIKILEGTTSEDGKRALIEGLTEAVVAVRGEAIRPQTWVVVTEVKSGEWGAGGRLLTSPAVDAVAKPQ